MITVNELYPNEEVEFVVEATPKADYTTIDAVKELAEMPYDHRFDTPRGSQLCHSTGRAVSFKGEDFYWNEYEDSDGNLYYGN